MTKVINLRRIRKNNYKLYDRNNLKNKNARQYKKDFNNILFTAISLISIIIGCLLYKNNQINEISDACINLIKQLQSKEFFSIFFSYLKLDIVFFLLLFFLGTSILGAPLSFIPIVFKCVFIGYLSSLMYNEFGLKGVLFCLVLLYPLFAVTTTSLIYAANESIFMCKYFLDLNKNKNTANDISVRLYLIRYAFLLGINLISVAINSLLSMVIANKFNLF